MYLMFSAKSNLWLYNSAKENSVSNLCSVKSQNSVYDLMHFKLKINILKINQGTKDKYLQVHSKILLSYIRLF